ncbi:ribonuclease P protein subunit p21 isoform X1 [Podarcis muralis]
MIKDKEAFQRLSFLYQAAHCVLRQNPENQELARFYCHTQNSISRRLVLRQDPSVKRTICRSCFSPLVPGVSSTVRQRSFPDSFAPRLSHQSAVISGGPLCVVSPVASPSVSSATPTTSCGRSNLRRCWRSRRPLVKEQKLQARPPAQCNSPPRPPEQKRQHHLQVLDLTAVLLRRQQQAPNLKGRRGNKLFPVRQATVAWYQTHKPQVGAEESNVVNTIIGCGERTLDCLETKT